MNEKPVDIAAVLDDVRELASQAPKLNAEQCYGPPDIIEALQRSAQALTERTTRVRAPEAISDRLAAALRAPLTVAIQRQLAGTFEMTLPGGQKVPVNRKDRRAIDAESRRKKRRGHARH